jgi:hypothetical protein
MADNTLLNAGTGGDTIRDIDRGAGSKTQVVQLDFGGSSGNAEQLASLSNPYPIQPAATYFIFSAAGVNSSTTQLAASATFTGTVESIQNQQAISILLTSDQPGTLTLTEYIDAGGTRICNNIVETILANSPFSEAYTANGNYFRATFQNTGAATTTTFNLNVAYGTLPAVSTLGNGLTSLNEVNGVNFTLGQKTAANSLPVALPSDQFTAASTQPAFTSPAVTVADRATGAINATAPSSAMYAAGSFNSTLPTLTTGQMGALQLTTKGEQLVSLSTGGTSVGITAASVQPTFATAALTVADRATGASAAAVPSSIMYAGATFTTTQPTVTSGQLVGLQTTSRGALLVSLASADNTATAAGFVKLTDGTTAVPVKAASTAVAATDAAMVVGLSPNMSPSSSDINSAATTNATSIKASAGTVFSVTASNTGAAAAFVKLYNLATAPTVGTSVPVLTISVPASGTVTVNYGTFGKRYTTGIALAITNLAADTDTTAVAAAQVKVQTSYV